MASRTYKFKIGTMPGLMYQVRKQSINQLRIGGRVFIREPEPGSKWEQVVIDQIHETPEVVYFAYKL